jgi:hypothetical protein
MSGKFINYSTEYANATTHLLQDDFLFLANEKY